ncbi:MAG TPA: cation:proton antiporter [Actinomycetota bacterium]|nr:cation:proton antiporter [Actinomycetota bacterium]
MALAGLAVVGVALLPRVLSGRALSYPIVFVVGGAALMLLPIGLTSPDPLRYPELTERVAELGVIIALTGAGLKLNRPPGLRTWATTWRLLGITMPLTIISTTLLGVWLLDLGLPAALLLGAVLAPTDPVLASDVQVEAPNVGGEGIDDHEVRFALTSEAGLNDGLAFPFTNAAIAMAAAGTSSEWVVGWILDDVLYKIVAGAAIGYLLGRVLARVIFEFPRGGRIAESSEGLVVIAATLLVYGLAEMAHTYGFLAVFVSALALRAWERDHEYHSVLHEFSDQLERVLSAILLLALGAAVVGGLLSPVGVGAVLCTVLLLLVVRPFTGLIAQLGLRVPRRDKLTISFFGIRGIGSIYYLAHGLNEGIFATDAKVLWSVVGLVILTSIFLHGITSGPWMSRIERPART